MISLDGSDEESYVIDMIDGSRVRASTLIGGHFEILLGPGRAGAIEGMLGDGDGDVQNDGVTSDGRPIDVLDQVDLYGDYARSWQVEPTPFNTPLDDADTEPILPTDFRLSLSDLEPDLVEEKLQICRDQGVEAGAGLTQCAFDLALTDDPRWAEATLSVEALSGGGVDASAVLAESEDTRHLQLPVRITGDRQREGLGNLESGLKAEVMTFSTEEPALLVVAACERLESDNDLTVHIVAPDGDFIDKIPLRSCRPGRIPLVQPGRHEIRVVDSSLRGGAYSIELALIELGERIEVSGAPTSVETAQLGGRRLRSDWRLSAAQTGSAAVVVEDVSGGCHLPGSMVEVRRFADGEVIWSEVIPESRACRALGPIPVTAGDEYLMTFRMSKDEAEKVGVAQLIVDESTGAVELGRARISFSVDLVAEREPELIDVASLPIQLAGSAPHNLWPARWSLQLEEGRELDILLTADSCPGGNSDSDPFHLRLLNPGGGLVAPHVVIDDLGSCQRVLRYAASAGTFELIVTSAGVAAAGFELELQEAQ